MIADLSKGVSVGGGALVLSQLTCSPVLTLIMQSAIILTCTVIMAHYLIKCRRENARRKQLKNREAQRGRVGADSPR